MMADRVSYQKMALYGLAIAALVGANIWRWTSPEMVVENTPTLVGQSRIGDLPGLSVAQDFTGFLAPMSRDLFASGDPDIAPAPVVEPVVQPEPAPDPDAIAREKARIVFNGIVVLGILGSNNGPVAVVEYGGSVNSVSVGQEILPGYVVQSLSLTHLEVLSQESGQRKIFLVNVSGSN